MRQNDPRDVINKRSHAFAIARRTVGLAAHTGGVLPGTGFMAAAAVVFLAVWAGRASFAPVTC